MAEEEKQIQSLQCELRDLDVEKTPKTVGDLYELSCSGLWEEPLSENTKIKFEKEGMKYALHIVSVKKTSSNEFVAEVSCYLPNQYSNQEFLLVDGDTSFKVQGLSWAYESVLQKAEEHQKETIEPPPEKLEPYPYFGPIGIHYPSWVWLILAMLVAVAGGFIFRWQKKRLQKKKLIDAALSGMGSALTPYQDFNKSLRQILRKNGDRKIEPQIVLDDLEGSFKSYLTRALTVPAFDWSEAEIIKDIRKNHRNVFLDNGKLIVRLLREFDRAKGQSVARQDVEQLTELSRRTVEGIDRDQMASNRGKGAGL